MKCRFDIILMIVLNFDPLWVPNMCRTVSRQVILVNHAIFTLLFSLRSKKNKFRLILKSRLDKVKQVKKRGVNTI